MYYKISSYYLLRGWIDSPRMLLRKIDNAVRFLDKEEFDALLLSDGETEIAIDELGPSLQSAFHKLISQRIILETERIAPINDEQYYHQFPNRFVRFALWSITGGCNYRCRHCFMDAPCARLGEMSHEEAIDIIDQMKNCGVLRVALTGGEPLIRKDFWELVDRMVSNGIRICQVYTNGWLLNEKVLEEFKKRDQRPEFSISFDGLGWHDWMRGIKGAEEAALNALRLCKTHGFPMNVEMCVHKGNLGVLRETINYLAELGVPSIKVINVSETELWKKNSEGRALNQKEYAEAMLEYIPQYFEDGMPTHVVLGGIAELNPKATYMVLAEKYDDAEKCERGYLCGAARFTCYITPEGRLLPCMPMSQIEDQEMFPRIQDIGLQMGLTVSSNMEYLNKRVKDLFNANETCGACQYRYKCGGGCRAHALLGKDQDLMGCDYDQCMIFKNGYPDRIRAAADAAIAKYCSDSKKESE